MAIAFARHFDPRYGESVPILAGVSRVTAPNPGPLTFRGTNSYLVGERSLAVIDPGPDDVAHLDALRRAIGGRDVTHILITHAHRDHSGLACRLGGETGAPTLAAKPREYGAAFEGASIEAGSSPAFRPDCALADGDRIGGDGWTLKTVLTPGHAPDHACFALEGTGALFSGDHVMGWSTTVVAPPDGSMGDYLQSLDRLAERGDRLLLPGHGGPIHRPRTFLCALKAHRRMRERAIVGRLKAGDRTIPEIVSVLYADLDPHLRPAAQSVVLAHLEDLVARSLAVIDGPPGLQARFMPN